MRKLSVTLCLTIAGLLGSVGVSESGDYQNGLDAYKSGDYATALRELRPLEEESEVMLGTVNRRIAKNKKFGA